MRKMLCVLAAVMAVLCLSTACNFTTNFSDSTGNSAMQAISKVEDMMAALAGGDADAALVLMHSSVAENSESAIVQMCDYLAGRGLTELDQKSVSVNTSSGSAGSIRQETAVFQAVLEDGTRIYLSVAYRTDNEGEGFVSFQIVLGAV